MPIKPLSRIEIGSRIQRHRRARGLTLGDLARNAGLTVQELAMIEQGLRDPSVSTADFIAKGLGLTLGDILAPRDKPSDKAREFLELYAGAPDTLRQALAQLLKASLA